MKTQTPISSELRNADSVSRALATAACSFVRPGVTGSSIDPETSMSSSTADGLRIDCQLPMAAVTVASEGLGRLTRGPAGSTPTSALRCPLTSAAGSTGRKPYRGRICCAAGVLRNATNACPGARCCAVTHGEPRTTAGLSDHIDPSLG